MFTGRSKQLGFYVIASVVCSLLAQSCLNSISWSDTNYIPPSPPGPVTETGGIKKVSPVAINDYLLNPGIGWQDGPEPFGLMNFPGTVDYSNRREIAWSILNPAEGVYDWSALDAQLDSAVLAGKQYSFRVYTFVGEGYDDNMIPVWVMGKGASLLPSGEPDYSNCIYQEEWGRFVDELKQTYDGNSHIAFIDISGYGDFNEWSWRDEQTEWDEAWSDNYANGTPSDNDFQTLDGQARRRLADIFIGGSFDSHACRMPNGEISEIDYSYDGFKKTQLVMPYAGIVQSTQYVLFRRSDVGFRHDCLGRDGQRVFGKIGKEISQIWQNAPVIYELCKPDEVKIEDAKWLLQMSHGSIVHNNNWSYSLDQLSDMMLNAGYRYFLKEATVKIDDRVVNIQMEWQNIGLAPSYPQMGQMFAMNLYLVDYSGEIVFQAPVEADIVTWMPVPFDAVEASGYRVSRDLELPKSIRQGKYLVGVSIMDTRTGEPINLAFGGKDSNKINILFSVEID